MGAGEERRGEESSWKFFLKEEGPGEEKEGEAFHPCSIIFHLERFSASSAAAAAAAVAAVAAVAAAAAIAARRRFTEVRPPFSPPNRRMWRGRTGKGICK